MQQYFTYLFVYKASCLDFYCFYLKLHFFSPVRLSLNTLKSENDLEIFNFFSSPEPEAQDELLWSLSVRRFVVCRSVHTFEWLLLWNPWAKFLQIMWSLV